MNLPQIDYSAAYANNPLGAFFGVLMQTRQAENNFLMRAYVESADPAMLDAHIEIAMKNVERYENEAAKLRQLVSEKNFDASTKMLIENLSAKNSALKNDADNASRFNQAMVREYTGMFKAALRGSGKRSTKNRESKGLTYDRLKDEIGKKSIDRDLEVLHASKSLSGKEEEFWKSATNYQKNQTDTNKNELASNLVTLKNELMKKHKIKRGDESELHVLMTIAEKAEDLNKTLPAGTKTNASGKVIDAKPTYRWIQEVAREEINMLLDKLEESDVMDLRDDEEKKLDYNTVGKTAIRLEKWHKRKDEAEGDGTETPSKDLKPEELMQLGDTLFQEFMKEKGIGFSRTRQAEDLDLPKFPTEGLTRAEAKAQTARGKLDALLTKQEKQTEIYQERISNPYAAIPEGGLFTKRKRGPHPLQSKLGKALSPIIPPAPPEVPTVKPKTSKAYPNIEINKEYGAKGGMKFGVNEKDEGFVVYKGKKTTDNQPQINTILKALNEKLGSR